MQAHHDYCPYDALPANTEKTLHLYEHEFEDCYIQRQYDPALKPCPAFPCGEDAKQGLIDDGQTLFTNCNSTCDSDECTAAFQRILMAHDTCDEDDLPGVVETTLHDFEEVCEAAICNTVADTYDLNAIECTA